MPTPLKPLYKLSEVALMLGWTYRKVYMCVRRGHLEGEKIGGKWYVTMSALRGNPTIWESIELVSAYRD